MTTSQLATEFVPVTPTNRLLTAAEFHQLADVPPEVEWFANLTNRHTRRVYQNAISDFMRFTGIERPEEFRSVTRAHCIAWRDDLMKRVLSGLPLKPLAAVAGIGALAWYGRRRMKGAGAPKHGDDFAELPY
jgi:hypothetical protein